MTPEDARAAALRAFGNVTATEERFYETQRVLLAPTVPVPIGVDTSTDDSYFKFNLDYINLYNLVRLEASSAGSIYQSAYGVLRDHTAAHQNAFFNIIDRGLNGPNAVRDSQTLALLDAWLLRLRRHQELPPSCLFRRCRLL